MKKTDHIILGLLICIIFYVVNDAYISKKRHQTEMRKLTRIEAKVDRKINIDSMYLEHVTKCAFIDKENVKVGYDGYLYSAYHRNSGLIK